MKKVLSVSIAAYNVEQFLGKALDSCLIPEIMDKLEIIVVNDGSTDGTAALAQTYVDRWPETFHLISKANGGYGSTVNAGIRAATGKYFRLLDGDDWFDRDGLIQFVDALEQAQEDMVIARFKRVFEADGHEEERDEAAGISFEAGKFEDVNAKDWFTMHAITYRTSLLQDHNITLTEHCFYTDQEYDLLPLAWVETIRFLPYVVYCYRIGRSEQSVSPAGLEKHYQEQTTVLKRLYSVYPQVYRQETAKDRYIYHYFLKRTRLHLMVYLVISASKAHKQELREFLDYLKTEQPSIYRDLLSSVKTLKVLIYSNYLLYGPLHRHRVKKYRY